MFRWSRKGQLGAGFSQALYYYPSLCVQPAQSGARQHAVFVGRTVLPSAEFRYRLRHDGKT